MSYGLPDLAKQVGLGLEKRERRDRPGVRGRSQGAQCQERTEWERHHEDEESNSSRQRTQRERAKHRLETEAGNRQGRFVQ